MPHDADHALPLPPLPGPEDRPHIYVINSDSAFLEAIGDLLADTRVHVTLEQLRPNVEVSLENLRAARPDLLILDAVPFHSDAEVLLERLVADAHLGHLPVMLASTSSKLAERLANTYAAVVQDILPKPFDLADFFLKLHRLVGIRVP